MRRTDLLRSTFGKSTLNVFAAASLHGFCCGNRDEDTLSSNDFLGTTLISLYSLRDGQSWVAWFPLHKRSSKSTISGEIEIEFCCERVPGLDPAIERLYREVTLMPDMCFGMLSNPKERSLSNDSTSKIGSHRTRCENSWQSLREAKGFPFCFPPPEAERLEDISVRATLIAQTYLGKISSPGILLLTNYRLIFVSRMRLTHEYHVKRNNLMKESDLTCYIALGCICDVSVSNNDTDQTIAGKSGEALSVKTIDGRNITFFINASEYYELGAASAIARELSKDSLLSKSTKLQGVNSSAILASTSHHDLHTRLNGKRGPSNIGNRVLAHSSKEPIEDNKSGSRQNSKEDASVARGTPGVLTSQSSGSLTEARSNLQPLRSPRSPIPPPKPSPVSVGDVVRNDNQTALQMSGVSKAWEALCLHPKFGYLDALDSVEGGPATRMHCRLYLRVSV
jgi:hypothetical protein